MYSLVFWLELSSLLLRWQICSIGRHFQLAYEEIGLFLLGTRVGSITANKDAFSSQ